MKSRDSHPFVIFGVAIGLLSTALLILAFGQTNHITQVKVGPPPVLSGISATNITSGSATIVWTTNLAAASQVEYGTTVRYNQSSSLNGTSPLFRVQ